MSKLTVTEKEHWKERVERRINKAIDALGQQHPSFMANLQAKARERTLKELGVLDIKQQLESLETESARLRDEKDSLERLFRSKVTGKPEKDCQQYYMSSEADRVLNAHQAVIEDEQLTKSPTGRRFLALRREKDELLDTIWLATSSRQIKELWQHMATILGEECTQLQHDVLSTDQ